MKDVGGVCMRHPPCAGAFAPEDEDKEKRSFPLWAGQTTFLIVIAEVLPSVSNRLSRSPFRITVRSAVASSCYLRRCLSAKETKGIYPSATALRDPGPSPRGSHLRPLSGSAA